MLNRLERGLLPDIRFGTLLNLCRAFDVSLDQLTGMDRDWPQQGACCICASPLEGALHRMKDCVLALDRRSFSVERIATALELPVPAVRAILDEEYRSE